MSTKINWARHAVDKVTDVVPTDGDEHQREIRLMLRDTWDPHAPSFEHCMTLDTFLMAAPSNLYSLQAYLCFPVDKSGHSTWKLMSAQYSNVAEGNLHEGKISDALELLSSWADVNLCITEPLMVLLMKQLVERGDINDFGACISYVDFISNCNLVSILKCFLQAHTGMEFDLTRLPITLKDMLEIIANAPNHVRLLYSEIILLGIAQERKNEVSRNGLFLNWILQNSRNGEPGIVVLLNTLVNWYRNAQDIFFIEFSSKLLNEISYLVFIDAIDMETYIREVRSTCTQLLEFSSFLDFINMPESSNLIKLFLIQYCILELQQMDTRDACTTNSQFLQIFMASEFADDIAVQRWLLQVPFLVCLWIECYQHLCCNSFISFSFQQMISDVQSVYDFWKQYASRYPNLDGLKSSELCWSGLNSIYCFLVL